MLAKKSNVFSIIENILIAFILLVVLISLAYLPPISLAEGLGYDGVWYHSPAVNLFSKIDNYHLFRIFPSALVFCLRKAFGFDNSIQSTVFLFRWLNFGFLIGTLVFFKLIVAKLKFTGPISILLLVFIFFNFNVCKEIVFNPVMTDNCTFFLSIGILYFYLGGHFIPLFCFLIVSIFTMPIVALFYPTFFLFYEMDSSDKQKIGWIKAIENFFWIFPLFLAIGFMVISSVIVYYFKRITVYTFPAEIDLRFFPFILVINAAFIFYFILKFKLFFVQLLFKIQNIRSWIYSKWIISIVGLFIFQFIVSKINNYHLLGYSGLLVGYPIILNLKPLIGLIDNLNFYGPVIFVFLIYFFFQLSSMEIRISDWFLMFFFFLIIIKPEARHTLFLLPLMSVFLCRFLSGFQISTRFLIVVLAIGAIFSKFWYPTHWAIFPPAYLIFSDATDPKIFQQFPIQHYFMFQGPMMSTISYLIILCLELLCFWFIFKEFNKLKINSL